MSAVLLVVATAVLLLALPALFLGGKLHERYRGPSAQANAAAAAAGTQVGARHFNVATDVQQSAALVSRVITPTHEGIGESVRRRA